MPVCVEYKTILNEAVSKKKQIKKFFDKLHRTDEKKMNHLFNRIHDKVFERIDCLKCGNCCSTISPMISDNDIQKMAKALKSKPSEITSGYLLLDNDNDYVFKSVPCPFINAENNLCSVYGSHPRACREYPHTNRQNVVQILNLTYKNTFICPAVYLIIKEIQTMAVL